MTYLLYPLFSLTCIWSKSFSTGVKEKWNILWERYPFFHSILSHIYSYRIQEMFFEYLGFWSSFISFTFLLLHTLKLVIKKFRKELHCISIIVIQLIFKALILEFKSYLVGILLHWNLWYLLLGSLKDGIL